MCCGIIPLTKIVADVIWIPGIMRANTPPCTAELITVAFVNTCIYYVIFINADVTCFWNSVTGAFICDHVSDALWLYTVSWNGLPFSAAKLGSGIDITVTFIIKLYMKM